MIFGRRLSHNTAGDVKISDPEANAVRILLLYNPVAGRGKAAAAVEGLRVTLREAGHDPIVKRTEPEPAADWLDSALRGVDLLLVVGGDGAVRLAGDSAARTGTPLYTFPLGTENLFAREFGIGRSRRQLLGALERFEIRRVDLGVAGEESFLLMASLGLDASMVQEVADRRRGGITRLSYIVPGLRQLRRWRAPRLTIHVDDEVVVREGRGFVVVANSRQYAARLDPALRASMSDGLLDVVFFPCGAGPGVLAWLFACRTRTQVRSTRVTYRRGSRILLRSEPEHPYQLDGDAPGPTSPASELSIAVRAGALPVIVTG
jgi:diacylglycerol kinase family enzyme